MTTKVPNSMLADPAATQADLTALSDSLTASVTSQLAAQTEAVNDAIAAIPGPVPNVKLAGDIVQVVLATTNAKTSGPLSIPLDNTPPTSTEGIECLTGAITPTSATSRLQVEVLLQASGQNAGGTIAAALFRDAGTAAVTAGAAGYVAANGFAQVSLRYEVVAGSVSATTFKLRFGGDSVAGPLVLNSMFSTVCVTSMKITEIKV